MLLVHEKLHHSIPTHTQVNVTTFEINISENPTLTPVYETKEQATLQTQLMLYLAER